MFFKVAREGRNNIGIYIGTILMIFFATMIGNAPLMLAIAMKSSDGASSAITDVSDLYAVGLDGNLMLALIIVPFAFGLGALLLCVKKLHQRSIKSVLTSRVKLDWGRIGLAFGLWFVINGLFEVFNYFMTPEYYTFRPPGMSFVILVLIALTLLPLQIAFEEVLFRGYLLQGIGNLFNNRWVPLIATSVAFGLMHLANPEVSEYGTMKMMSYYIGIGLVLGIMTVMDDGLELALGVHAATNIYSATIVSYDAGALQTNALFHSTADIADSSIFSFLVFSAIFVLILSRIYRWKNWSKLWTSFPAISDPPSQV